VRGLVVGRGALVEKLPEQGIEVDTFDFTRSYNLDFLRFIRRLIARHKIDIVHTHMSRMNMYGRLASLFTPAVNVMTVHGLTEFSGFWGRLYYALLGPSSGKVVTVSDKLAERFREATHVGRKKIAVIPNGIDTARFNREVDIAAARDRFRIPRESRVVLAVGNIREIKGYELLIESLAAVADREPQLAVVISGGNYAGYKKNLEPLIARHGLEKRVIFTSFVPDIEVLYRIADIYALTSISEGFSLTTVEAMASSLPVVSTDCVGPRDIIDDSRDGIIVPDRDPRLFGEVILGLIGDEKKRKALGEAARRKAEEKFSAQVAVRKYEELFGSLVRTK